MGIAPVHYGPNSPFTEEERQTVDTIYEEVMKSRHPDAEDFRSAIVEQVCCLEWLGQVFAQYPSPLQSQRLGRRMRGLSTLVDALSHSNPANFEYHLPTRALIGRSLDMAEGNFYRLLRHVCAELHHEDKHSPMYEEATQRLKVCLYTQMVEDILSSIATNSTVSPDIREKAVEFLARIWESRLTFRTSHFFPILEATWESRQQTTAVGGTLAGTQEIFELFSQGCDPRFVDFFARPDPPEEELQAFREFLFATPAEDLDKLQEQIAEQNDVNSVLLHDAMTSPDHDSVSVFYEFFRTRHLMAVARRVAKTPGPKQTAEGYIIINSLLNPENVETP